MTKASGVSESRESRSLGSLGVLGVSGVSESQTVNCTIASGTKTKISQARAKNSLCCKTVAIFIGGISKSKFLRYVDDLIDLRHGQDCMKISLGPPFGASSLKIAFPMCPRFPAMGFTP